MRIRVVRMQRLLVSDGSQVALDGGGAWDVGTAEERLENIDGG
jgi:hypothetical protein